MKNLKAIFPAEFLPVLFLSTIVLLECIQAVLIAAWILGFFPLENSLSKIVFREWLGIVRPEREVVFFRFFVGTAIVGQIIALKIFQKKFRDERLLAQLKTFAAVEGMLVFFILSALFKTVIYDDRPQLAHTAYDVLLVLAVLNKIFWIPVRNFGYALYEFLMNERNALSFKMLADFLFPILIFVLLYLPDSAAVMARMFIGEQFHHYDSFIMAPAWAYTSGNILNIDQVSQYGVGMPAIISQLTKLFGGFSYLNVFLVILWGCIIYYLIWFWFLRRWYKSAAMAILAMLVGIRIQMFHTGVFPFIFALPSATVIRYWFDALFFVMMFLHLQKNRSVFLWLAAVISGVATFYMFSTGIYLIVCLYAYLLCHLLIPHLRRFVYHSPRDFIPLLGYGALALGTTLALTWLTVGKYLWSAEYWHNMNEFLQYFVSGAGAMPIFGSLKEHNFLASSIGFLIPAVYVLSILLIFSLCFFNKMERENLLVILLCINGLGLNQYYIMLSAITSYYTTGLPFIFVAGYWLHMFLKHLNETRRKKILLTLIILSMYALITNHNYLAYPNMINVCRNPLLDRLVAQRIPDGRAYFNHLYVIYSESFKLPKNSLGEVNEDLRVEENFISQEELKAYYHQEFDFTEDALLIQKLTELQKKVPLISAFDIKILMQANRRPFFYHFPLAISRPMHSRMFPNTGMYTTTALKKVISQLEQEKPEYIFMERLYLNREVPQYYYYFTPALLSLLDYVHQHYEPFSYGKYLVAMKCKDAQ